MQPSARKKFKSDEAELILLRLQLSNIKAEFWLDLDGFFNYSFAEKADATLPISENHSSINWTRIDEVISKMAYDATILYPRSAFAFWYNEPVELLAEDRAIDRPPLRLTKSR